MKIGAILFCVVIENLEKELAGANEVNSNASGSIHEQEVEILHEEIEKIEYQNALNVAQLEEYAKQDEYLERLKY